MKKLLLGLGAATAAIAPIAAVVACGDKGLTADQEKGNKMVGEANEVTKGLEAKFDAAKDDAAKIVVLNEANLKAYEIEAHSKKLGPESKANLSEEDQKDPAKQEAAMKRILGERYVFLMKEEIKLTHELQKLDENDPKNKDKIAELKAKIKKYDEEMKTIQKNRFPVYTKLVESHKSLTDLIAKLVTKFGKTYIPPANPNSKH